MSVTETCHYRHSVCEELQHWCLMLDLEWHWQLCVLIQHLKKKNRIRMIEYFIDVAKECINIGNFNSLMAIIGEWVLQTRPKHVW